MSNSNGRIGWEDQNCCGCCMRGGLADVMRARESKSKSTKAIFDEVDQVVDTDQTKCIKASCELHQLLRHWIASHGRRSEPDCCRKGRQRGASFILATAEER